MARTQEALYAELDVELSWSERELPERERTKPVHVLGALALGQLALGPRELEVDVGVERFLRPGHGTTLVAHADGSGRSIENRCRTRSFRMRSIERMSE